MDVRRTGSNSREQLPVQLQLQTAYGQEVSLTHHGGRWWWQEKKMRNDSVNEMWKILSRQTLCKGADWLITIEISNELEKRHTVPHVCVKRVRRPHRQVLLRQNGVSVVGSYASPCRFQRCPRMDRLVTAFLEIREDVGVISTWIDRVPSLLDFRAAPRSDDLMAFPTF